LYAYVDFIVGACHLQGSFYANNDSIEARTIYRPEAIECQKDTAKLLALAYKDDKE
jgi:hypothetical protein